MGSNPGRSRPNAFQIDGSNVRSDRRMDHRRPNVRPRQQIGDHDRAACAVGDQCFVVKHAPP